MDLFHKHYTSELILARGPANLFSTNFLGKTIEKQVTTMRRLLDFMGGFSAAWSNSETNNYSIGGGFIPSSPCHYCGDMGVMSATENGKSTTQILNHGGARRRFVLEGISHFSFCRYCRLIWEVAESYSGSKWPSSVTVDLCFLRPARLEVASEDDVNSLRRLTRVLLYVPKLVSEPLAFESPLESENSDKLAVPRVAVSGCRRLHLLSFLQRKVGGLHPTTAEHLHVQPRSLPRSQGNFATPNEGSLLGHRAWRCKGP